MTFTYTYNCKRVEFSFYSPKLGTVKWCPRLAWVCEKQAPGTHMTFSVFGEVYFKQALQRVCTWVYWETWKSGWSRMHENMRCWLKWPPKADFKSSFVVQNNNLRGKLLFGSHVFKPCCFGCWQKSKFLPFVILMTQFLQAWGPKMGNLHTC